MSKTAPKNVPTGYKEKSQSTPIILAFFVVAAIATFMFGTLPSFLEASYFRPFEEAMVPFEASEYGREKKCEELLLQKRKSELELVEDGKKKTRTEIKTELTLESQELVDRLVQEKLNELLSHRRKEHEQEIEERLEKRWRKRKEELERNIDTLVKERMLEACNNQNQSQGQRIISSQSELLPTKISPSSDAPKAFFNFDVVRSVVNGMAAIRTSDFLQAVDVGVPFDALALSRNTSNVLVLFGKPQQRPRSLTAKQISSTQQTSIPLLSEIDGLENCGELLVLPIKERNTCVALVPYRNQPLHFQKWMRISKEKVKGRYIRDDRKGALRLVGQKLGTDGIDSFAPPRKKPRIEAITILQKYLLLLDDVLKDIKSIIADKRLVPYSKASPLKIITIMVSNFGQSEILMNFACNAHARGLDTSSVLVFAADKETLELAESVGLVAYYNEKMFSHVPYEAAGLYGDKRFASLMTLKIISVHLIVKLGYDVLFQDADIVWFQNPVTEYFGNHTLWNQDYDFISQEDGSRSERFGPYDANSGFYFVRNNERTHAFVEAMLFSMSYVLSVKSHQQILIKTLSEYVSLVGLRAKVVSRDSDDLPCGYQWHRNHHFMRKMFQGEVHPVVFHMSWTSNKENKIKFFQQMGEWYLSEKCSGKKLLEINGENKTNPNAHGALVETCCMRKPTFKCHFRDKPSLYDCSSQSAPLDGGAKSFWRAAST